MERKEYLSTRQCAEYLKLSESTLKIWRWARQHRIEGRQYGPTYKAAGRRILYELAAIEDWLKNCPESR